MEIEFYLSDFRWSYPSDVFAVQRVDKHRIFLILLREWVFAKVAFWFGLSSRSKARVLCAYDSSQESLYSSLPILRVWLVFHDVAVRATLLSSSVITIMPCWQRLLIRLFGRRQVTVD